MKCKYAAEAAAALAEMKSEKQDEKDRVEDEERGEEREGDGNKYLPDEKEARGLGPGTS